jgi:hypothetical protein
MRAELRVTHLKQDFSKDNFEATNFWLSAEDQRANVQMSEV